MCGWEGWEEWMSSTQNGSGRCGGGYAYKMVRAHVVILGGGPLARRDGRIMPSGFHLASAVAVSFDSITHLSLIES